MTDPFIGQTIGSYEIRAPLGAGGMARVYRALDRSLQREVALKLLYDPMQRNADFAERFLREARTLAGLKHPNIVHIYNVGQHDGMSYLVQELLPGPTLEEEQAQLLGQGRFMELDRVHSVVTQLGSALDYAHSRGIIHRDLKPSNCLRNDRGEIVLVDFGIAKEIGGVEKLTRTGLVMGTPQYLAPEQAMGGAALTHALDIYALGVILFELLTGRVPFDDPSPLSIALAHVNQPPPRPSSLRPDLPPAVEDVVMKALAKAPEFRFPSAGALAGALAAAISSGRPAAGHVTAAPVNYVNPSLPSSQPGVHQAQTAVNPVPAGRQDQPGVHQAQTAVNPVSAGSPRPPAHVAPQPSAHVAPQPPAPWQPPPRPPAPERPAGAGSRKLVLVAGLLALGLLAGFLLLRPEASENPLVAGAQSTQTTGRSTAPAAEEPPADEEPTEEPTEEPVEPTEEPAAVSPPASPAEAIGQAFALLDQALSAGQIDANIAQDFQSKLEELAEKIGEGKSGEVRKKARELQDKIAEAEQKGQLAPEVAAQLQTLMQYILDTTEDEGNGKEKEKDKDKDKDEEDDD